MNSHRICAHLEHTDRLISHNNHNLGGQNHHHFILSVMTTAIPQPHLNQSYIPQNDLTQNTCRNMTCLAGPRDGHGARHPAPRRALGAVARSDCFPVFVTCNWMFLIPIVVAVAVPVAVIFRPACPTSDFFPAVDFGLTPAEQTAANGKVYEEVYGARYVGRCCAEGQRPAPPTRWCARRSRARTKMRTASFLSYNSLYHKSLQS